MIQSIISMEQYTTGRYAVSDDKVVVVSVADYTIAPGARYREDGDGNATEFYERYVLKSLKKAVKTNQDFVIDLDSTYGYASSFISELAMRIATEFDKEWIKEHLDIKSDDDPIAYEGFWNEFNKDYTK